MFKVFLRAFVISKVVSYSWLRDRPPFLRAIWSSRENRAIILSFLPAVEMKDRLIWAASRGP